MTLSLVLAVAVLAFSPNGRRPRLATTDTAAEFEAIAAELRRGASLRHAIAAAYPESQLARLAHTGQPMGWVAAELARRSVRADTLISAGLQLAAVGGASAAPLFIALAQRVRTQRDLAAKRRVLVAQAKASALVIASLPLLVGLPLVLTRSLGVLSTSAAARTAVLVGISLEIVGAGLVVLMVKRAGR